MGTDGTAPQTLDVGALLCAISCEAASARTGQAALEAVARPLVEAGFVKKARLDVHGDTVVSWAYPTRLPAPSGNGRSRRGNRSLPLPSDFTLSLSVPVQCSPRALLHLAPLAPLSKEVGEALTSQLALVIDRCYLESQANLLHGQEAQRLREVATVYEIGRAMDSVEIARLLEIITEKAAKVMHAQACSLMRVNADTKSLSIAASYGLSEDVIFVTQRAIGEGIAGRVAQSGEPMLINDAENDPRLTGVLLRPDIGSSMVVPMKDESGIVIGVLSIRRRLPEPLFTEDDLRLFSVFASQAALAISNKQLYDDLARRLKEISTLSELTQAVISHLDLHSLLDHVADNIVEVVKFDRCCVYLLDRHTRRYAPRILRGYPEDVIGRNTVRVGEGVIGIAAKKRISIVENDARSALQPIRGFARSLGVNAFVALPIISRGQTIGVVLADNKLSGRIMQPDSVELLNTFVNQAGIAIENAQLYEDREQRFQEINRLATQTDNILRSIAASVVVVDAAGRVTRWNKASEELWGVPEEQATQLSYVQAIERLNLPRDEVHQLYNIRQQVRETGKPFQCYKFGLHPVSRPEIVVNLLVSPLIDRQGEQQGIVLVLEDLTRETHLETEMDRMRRLADIGQLAAKMAHEVRNPLSSIKGAAQLMRNEYEELASLREFLDIIIDEVNGLNRLTTDMLDFARPMKVDASYTNLNDLIERTLALLAGMLEEARIATDLHLDPELPDMFADPKQIEQIMRNIVINAVQAMSGGGELTVTTEQIAEPPGVRVCFADSGVGIPPERLSEVFQPFVTTKTKGTGLGLAIVHRIVQNHRGSIDVRSEVGSGTSFAVTFPIRPDMVEAPEPLPSSMPLPDF